MEINPNQVQHVLRTYSHLIKHSATEDVPRDTAGEKRQEFDLVMLSVESTQGLKAQANQNGDIIQSES